MSNTNKSCKNQFAGHKIAVQDCIILYHLQTTQDLRPPPNSKGSSSKLIAPQAGAWLFRDPGSNHQLWSEKIQDIVYQPVGYPV